MIPVISFFLLISILPFHATAAPNTHADYILCTGSTYAVNSTYQANLNTLLSSLTAKSSSSLYNNATIGTSANQIYSLYVCDSDLSPADCQTCVQTSATNVTISSPPALYSTANCTSYRQAIIWYDYCMLRYSDANFFGVPDSDDGVALENVDMGITSLVPYQMVSNLVHAAPFRQPVFSGLSIIPKC